MHNHWMFLTEINIALKCFHKTSFRTRWSAVISWPHFTLHILVSVLISLISTTITLARYIVVKRQVPLVLPIAVHLSSLPVLSRVRVTRSLVLWVCFVDQTTCPFSLGHCVVCSSICEFWLHLWYLQTLLVIQYYCIISQ